MKKNILITAILLALTLAACGGSAGADLEGTEWALIELYGQPPVGGSQPTMRFEDNNISGNSSCNSYGGSYVLHRDGTLETGMLMSTMMACLDNGIMEQEQAFLELLGSGLRAQVQEEHLLLMDQSGAVQAVFVRVGGTE